MGERCTFFFSISLGLGLSLYHNHYGDESRHHYHMSTPKYFTTAAGDK